MKKRLLSLILCIVMTVTAMPLTFITGFASDDASAEAIAVTYDDLYVKDATFQWDAFDMKSTDTAITVFENQAGDTDVTLPVAVTMEDGYVLYPQTDASGRFNLSSFVPLETYDVGGTAYYKPGDYSLEMTVHQYWQDDFVTSIASNRIDYFGETSNISGQQNRLFYTFNSEITEESGIIAAAKFSPYSTTFGSSWNQTTISEAFINGLNKPYTIGINWDLHFDTMETIAVEGSFTINATRDGASLTGKTFGSKLTTNAGYMTGRDLYFGAVVPMAYYSIRVYPFALSAEQSAQNHFAELCEYFHIDQSALSAFVSLDEASQKEIRNEYIGITFDETSKEAIEQTISNKIDELASAEEHLKLKNLYSQLYVEDGAVFVWNAFLYGAVSGGYMVDLFDDTKTLGDGSVGIEKQSGFGYAAYAGRLDFTPYLLQDDGTYGDALSLEIGLRLTAEYGTMDRFFGPLAHLSNNNSDEHSKYTYKDAKRTDGGDSYGMIKVPYRAYPLATVATETYYFKSESDTVPITKAAYDALSATDKAAYTLSATVPYYKGNATLAFDQLGHWKGHVLGNYVNETYSFGVQMHFDKENSSFGFSFLRDSELARGTAVAREGMLYTPGMAYSGGPTFVAPTSYAAATANSALQNVTFSTWSTVDRGFYFGQASAEYYSIHIYSKELTDMQRKQNHFADIVSCFKPRNIETFMALPTEQKEAIYTLFSDSEEMYDEGTRNTSFEEIAALGGRAYIEDIIEYSGVDFRADSILSFNGYQMKAYGTPAYRAVFAVNEYELDEGTTLKSVGVLSASGIAFDDLAFVQDDEGVYTLAIADATNTVLFQDGEWNASLLTEDESGISAIFTKTYDGDLTNEILREKDYYRGYVILEKNGNEQVYYTSMNGIHVGERGVSMYGLATKFHTYPTSKTIIATCETASEKTYAVDSFFNEDGTLDTESTEPLTIVCIGGSLTELGNDKTASSGRKVWVEGIKKYFEERFPNREVTIHNAGVGGTTSSLGAMRFADQVIALEPDLVIIEFTVNDKKYDETTTQVHIENMIRQCLNADKVPAVVYAHTPFAVDKASDKYDIYTRQVGYKEEIVSHYGISYVNIYDAFYEIYLEKLAENPELDYITFLDHYYNRTASPDEFGDYFDVHPKADGYEVYLDAFIAAFDAELEVMLSRLREEEIHCVGSEQTVNRVSSLLSHDSDRISYEGDWDVYTQQNPYSNADKNAIVASHRYLYPFFDTGVHMAYKQNGAALSFTTTANMLSIYYLAQKAGMSATVKVDGVSVGKFETQGSAQQPFGGAFLDLGNPECKEVTVRIELDAITSSSYSFAFGYLAEIYYAE